MKKRHKSKAAQEAAERVVELYVRLLVLFGDFERIYS
jgi:hypothetical protein